MNIKIAFCISKLNLTYKDSIMKSILDEMGKKIVVPKTEKFVSQI